MRHYITGGFNLQLAQDLSKGTSGVAGMFVWFQNAIAGDCGVRTSALQQLICDDMARTNIKEYPTVLPADGSAKFGHTFASKTGVAVTKPTDATQIWWMQLMVEVEVKLTAVSVMVQVVARLLFDRDVTSEVKIMMKVGQCGLP